MTPKTKPFRVWHLSAPFTKHGVPVMGNFGASSASVVRDSDD